MFLTQHRKLVAWSIIVGSLLGAIVGVVLGVEELRFESGATRVTGTIIELRSRGESAFPVFRFQDTSGQSHTVESHIGSMDGALKVGQETAIIYRPESPNRARIESLATSRSMPLAMIGNAVVCVPLGVALLKWNRRPKPTTTNC